MDAGFSRNKGTEEYAESVRGLSSQMGKENQCEQLPYLSLYVLTCMSSERQCCFPCLGPVYLPNEDIDLSSKSTTGEVHDPKSLLALLAFVRAAFSRLNMRTCNSRQITLDKYEWDEPNGRINRVSKSSSLLLGAGSIT
jgi:hypothetical protein